MIHMLSALGNTGIALKGFEDGLGRLSLQDANNAIKVSQEILSRPSLSSKAYRVEFDRYGDRVQAMVERPDAVILNDPEGIAESVRGLTPELKSALRKRLGEYLQFKHRQVAQVLTRPESEWHKWQETPLSITTDDRDPVDALAAKISNNYTMSYSQPFAAQALRRSQLRILRATARVIAYKWMKGKLPENIERAVPPAELEDAASGEKLTYERPTPTTFVIQSKGFGDIGPFGLVYRPTSQRNFPPPGWVPPPKEATR